MIRIWLLCVYILAAGSCFSQARPINTMPNPVSVPSRPIDIVALGARPDGRTDCTKAIQKAIDAAAARGGGTVLVPAGRFVTGPIRLRSNIELRLSEHAVLLGSARRAAYGPGSASALIVADSQQHIAITGKGAIDGQGPLLIKDIYSMLEAGTLQDAEWRSYNPWGQIRPEERNRPKLIEFRNCGNILIKGITITDGLCWIQNYKNCTDITVDSIRVISNVMWNNDGIDLVDCRKARITHSFFNVDDDGICLKSESATGRCEDIVIEDCTIRSSASAFKIGTASHGRFSNIRVDGLKVYDTYRSAIALESVDGAILENIDVRNVSAVNTGNAFFLRLGHRNQKLPPGKLRNIYIGNVRVEVPAGKPDKGYEMEGPPVREPHNVFPSSIAGIPGSPVEQVTLENISITFPGGSSKDSAWRSPDSLGLVPEREQDYPEFSMFGELPAAGLFVRHANGLRLKNVQLTFKKEEGRPARVFDDVSGLVID